WAREIVAGADGALPRRVLLPRAPALVGGAARERLERGHDPGLRLLERQRTERHRLAERPNEPATVEGANRRLPGQAEELRWRNRGQRDPLVLTAEPPGRRRHAHRAREERGVGEVERRDLDRRRSTDGERRL